MRTPRLVALAVAAALALSTRPLDAQFIPDPGIEVRSASDAAAYLALSSTPIGGLTPAITAHFAGMARRGVGFHARFGYIDEDGPVSRRIYGAGVDIPFGRSALGLTGGFVDFACDLGDFEDPGFEIECKGGFMAGANWTSQLVTAPLGTTGNTSFVVGIDGALGYGSGDLVTISGSDPEFPEFSLNFSVEARALSVGLGLPLALVARSGRVTVVPHLTPRVGYGRATIELPFEFIGQDFSETESGTKFLLGGGVDFLFANSGLGLTVGFQKVFVEGSNTLIGAGLTFAMR